MTYWQVFGPLLLLLLLFRKKDCPNQANLCKINQVNLQQCFHLNIMVHFNAKITFHSTGKKKFLLGSFIPSVDKLGLSMGLGHIGKISSPS